MKPEIGQPKMKALDQLYHVQEDSIFGGSVERGFGVWLGLEGDEGVVEVVVLVPAADVDVGHVAEPKCRNKSIKNEEIIKNESSIETKKLQVFYLLLPM